VSFFSRCPLVLQKVKSSRWDDAELAAESTRTRESRWDTPERPASSETPVRRSRWGETPTGQYTGGETPGAGEAKKTRSRWDETPVASTGSATPVYNAGATPVGGFGMQTPVPMTPETLHAMRIEKDLDERNRPLTDEELDQMLPSEGYKILPPPTNYVPIHTPSRKLGMATPLIDQGFIMKEDVPRDNYGIMQTPTGGLPALKPEDELYFGKLATEVDEDQLTAEEAKERKIMKLLLKVKNGTPPMRKSALRQLTDKAREFGAGPLFHQILPLLMSPTLEDQERHLLVKVIDRVLYKLGMFFFSPSLSKHSR